MQKTDPDSWLHMISSPHLPEPLGMTPEHRIRAVLEVPSPNENSQLQKSVIWIISFSSLCGFPFGRCRTVISSFLDEEQH